MCFKKWSHFALAGLLFVISNISIAELTAPLNTSAQSQTAINSRTFSLNIASQQLNDSLIILSSQTQLSIAFKQGNLSMPICPAIHGEMTIEDALEALLNKSGYIYKKAGLSFIVKYEPPVVPIETTETDIKAPRIEEVFILGQPMGNNSFGRLQANSQDITSEEIALLGLDSADRVANTLPGIDVNSGPSPTIYIRGVGIDDNTDLSDPLVKYYENSIHLPKLTAFMSSWHDAEKISIEPGPQNQLHSEASVGGNINVQYIKPSTASHHGDISLTSGSFNTQKVNTVLNAAINSRNAIRASIEHYNRDSFFTNTSSAPTDIPGRVDTQSLRLQYHFDNLNGFSALYSHSRLYDNGTGSTTLTLTPYLQGARTPHFSPKVSDLLNDKFNKVHFVNVDSINRVRSRTHQLALQYTNNRINLQLNAAQNNGSVLNKTGGNRGIQLIDYTSNISPAPDTLNEFDFVTDYKDQTARNLSVGFSLVGDTLSWNNTLSLTSEKLFWFWGDSDDKANGYIGGQYNTYYQSGSRALYSELRYQPTPKHTFTVGVRKQANDKERNGIAILTENSTLPNLRHGSSGFEWNLSSNPNRTPNDFDDADEIDSNGNPVVNLSTEDYQVVTKREQWEAYQVGVKSWGEEDNVLEYLQQNGYDGNDFYLSSQNGRIGDDAIDWKIHYNFDIQSKPEAQRIIYTTIATATSNSGFNDNLSSDSYPTYAAEKALSITLGTLQKYSNITLAADIFHYRYKDKIAMINVAPSQAFDSVLTAAPTQSSNLETTNDFRVNIPKARSYGANINIDYALNSTWSMRINALYLNAEYVEGTILDSRMAAFSGFTNADPLRFNTPHTNTPIPDSELGTYSHTYNIYDYLLEPQYQQARPGADMNSDGSPSHYYQTSCKEGLSNIQGDGECYTVLNQAPDIEHPLRDLKGNKMPRSPTWDIYAEINYAKAMSFGKINVSIGAKYRSAYYLTPYNGNGYEPRSFQYENTNESGKSFDEAPSFYSRIPPHITVDAVLRWQSEGDDPWQVSLRGKNLSNTRYFTAITNTAWTYAVAVNAPRIWELNLKKYFKF